MAEANMVLSYRTLKEPCEAEIEEKKSRFIAHLQPVHSQEEAAEFIAGMKKKYWDARHNCYAYVIGADGALKNFSDDGEPSQTAGRPMLEILERNALTDAAVVVTRYFGGVLLGTGGLVRAYQGALQEALSAAEIVTMRLGTLLHVTTDYGYIGAILRHIEAGDVRLEGSEYTERIRLQVWVPAEQEEGFQKTLTQLTLGSAVFDREGQAYRAIQPSGSP